MSAIEQTLFGGIAIASMVAGHFFFRFWHQTRDRFFLKKVTRQSVYLAQVAVLVHRFGVDVVRGDVIGARHDESCELALLTRHAVQRLDVGRDGDDRYEQRLGVIEQLAPRPFHRHRLDLTTVTR